MFLSPFYMLEFCFLFKVRKRKRSINHPGHYINLLFIFDALENILFNNQTLI